MSDLKLPYTGEKLLELLGNIKTEEELKVFIKANISGGGHTDEQIRIIVAEWYQQNKDTPVTKEDVDGWIEEYLAENPVSGGLTEQQVNEIVAAYIRDNNISGSVSAEEIAQAVEDYIAEHPITGVTTEDIQNAVNAYLTNHPVRDGQNGVSPTVEVTEIAGGHRVTITDADGPQVFDIMNGKDGEGGSGSVSEEQIASAVQSYLEENPVNDGVSIYYEFANDTPANAEGKIYLFASQPDYLGDYEIYWSNEDGVLNDYTAINTLTLTATFADKIIYDKIVGANVIPEYATGISAVKDGVVVATYTFPSSKLWDSSAYGERLYSFGAVSDIHYQYDTGEDDFKAALEYFEKENVAAVCSAGDLTASGEVYQMQEVKNAVDAYLPNIPFYSCNGNHECWYYQPSVAWEQICSDGMWYLKEIDNDIFIFVNIHGKTASDVLFTDEELTWLEQTLETYRNQRVFLFQHVFPHNLDGFANPGDAYELNLWGTAADRVKFTELMEHYKNVIWFSGHSHVKYCLQESNKNCNYYRYKDGAQLVHLSSLTIPRDITDGVVSDYLYAQSEGTLVDVYQNHIVLRSRNFADEKFIGIAQYLIDTTPVEIEANENLVTKHYITNNLTYVTNSNSDEYVAENESYTATLTANNGYTLESVAVAMGDEDITSTSYDNGVITIANVTGAITITAIAVANEDTISCTSITLDNTELELTAENTATLTATVIPSNTTDELVWTSSNADVATVSNGVVTAVSTGSAKITATCGTQKAACEVTVSSKEEEGITVLYSLTGTYTLSSKGETIAIAEKNIDTENAGKHVYIKWDKLEYTGDDASAEKVGFLITLKNDSTQLYGAQYADYSNEVDAVGGSANTGVNNISISAKSSSSSTATFPATLSVTNLKVYVKDE